jgi:hypothetical protein
MEVFNGILWNIYMILKKRFEKNNEKNCVTFFLKIG